MTDKIKFDENRRLLPESVLYIAEGLKLIQQHWYKFYQEALASGEKPDPEKAKEQSRVGLIDLQKVYGEDSKLIGKLYTEVGLHMIVDPNMTAIFEATPKEVADAWIFLNEARNKIHCNTIQ